MIIRIDSRGSGEHEIYLALQSLAASSSYKIEHVPLDIGDYHILNDDETLAVVIERKSHSDLAGSLQSNHHMKEQLYRLQALKEQQPNVAVFLLYEGALTKDWINAKTGSIPNANIDMFLTVTACRDGVHVHYTANRDHSSKWIYALAKKEEKGQLRLSEKSKDSENKGSNYLSTLALTKQGNRKGENQWIRVLMSIDSISLDRAKAIAEKYPTCASLVKRVRDEEKTIEKELSELPVKKRKLGPALAKSLCTLFK
jgi:ERCC4-type nuclease